MDYEQKYKEILEWARKNKARLNGVPIEDVLPELADSEEERALRIIRKRMCYDPVPISDEDRRIVENWLEKQKEPHYTKRNALFDKCVENCDPKTVEEVNKRVDDIMNMPELSAFEQALTNFIGYWEDDEEHWPSKFVKKHGKHILDMAREELQKEQKPAEWSEEDEKLLNYAISMTEDAQVKRFLKSLRPSWKPSDKDEERLIKTSIVFLKDFADMGYENAVECIDWLKSKLNGNTCK